MVPGRSPRMSRRQAFTLIELLIVILIIAILIAIAVPTFLNQQQKAEDSAAQQVLNVGYTNAKAQAVSNNGDFTTNTYTGTNLSTDIAKSEPEYTVQYVATLDQVTTNSSKTLYVVGAGTANENLHLAYLDHSRMWTLTVVGDGSPVYTLDENSSPLATAVLDTSPAPTSFFRFEESGPGLAADSSASGNNGTLTGGYYNQPGPFNGSNGNYSFGGISSSGSGTLTLPPDVTFTNGTIEFWVKRTSNNTGYRMLYLINGPAGQANQQINVSYNTDGTLSWYSSLDQTNNTAILTSTQISNGQWNLIDFVRNTSTATAAGTNPQSVTLYVNGVQAGTMATSSTAAYNFPYGAPNAGYSTLGGSPSSNDYYADFAIYPGVLSATTILQHYQAASAATK